MKKAIVLLSGGIDSAVLLAHTKRMGREILCLSFHYGQRNATQELFYAKQLVKHYSVKHIELPIPLKAFAHSSLVDVTVEEPKNRSTDELYSSKTPNTYVPARNTLFLSFALAQAEILKAHEVYIACTAVDTAYPDCRKEYIESMQHVYDQATAQEFKTEILTPLLSFSKVQVLQKAISLKLPLHLTFSCYFPSSRGEHCWECDACQRRIDGFKELGIEDPLAPSLTLSS